MVQGADVAVVAASDERDERVEAPRLAAQRADDDVVGEEPVGLVVPALVDPQAVAGDEVGELGPASQSTLSDRTRVYRSDLVSVLNELTDGGWVRRAPDATDKRRNVVSITPAGERRLDELDAILEEVNDQVMAPLSPDDRTELFRLLERVNAHLAAGADSA